MYRDFPENECIYSIIYNIIVAVTIQQLYYMTYYIILYKIYITNTIRLIAE